MFCVSGVHSPMSKSRSEAVVISQRLDILLEDLERLRLKLGISHDDFREALGMCKQTYQNHTRMHFRTLDVEQLQILLNFCQKWELKDFATVNPRVQNHFRNKSRLAVLNPDEQQDDGNNGDYED